MLLQILIVHEFGIIRRIAHDYILAEITDAIVDLAPSSRDAIAMLDEKRYDVVLCGQEEACMNGFAIQKQVLALASQRSTDIAFVVMTSSYEEQRERFAGRGIEHVLSLPFTPFQLRDGILKATNPRSKRRSFRYSIPQTKAIIDFKGQHIIADVVNISINGVLCDIACPDQCVGLTGISLIAIQFPPRYGGANTGWITSKLLRLSITAWTESYSPAQLRAAWSLLDLSEEAAKALESALQQAHSELTTAEAIARDFP